MQEKKKLDDMAERYKEEMMRIYNKKRAAESSAQEDRSDGKRSHTPETQPECSEENPADVSKDMICENKERFCGDEPVHNTHDDEKLMHPPMPKIPHEGNKKSPEKNSGDKKTEPSAAESCSDEESKFPTAEELINMDSDMEDEQAVPAAAMQRQEHHSAPDARFESNGSDVDDTDNMDGMNNDGHLQGNYNFNSEPDAEYEKEMEDFESVEYSHRRNFRRTAGQGYLQAEVTDQGDGSPISGAAVVVVRKLGDSDSLETILTTDSKGMTESISLDVPDTPGHRGMNTGSEPYEEYMITVYKEGYYSVNMLPVPIFDTIKSIQPIEMTRVGNGSSN